MDTNTIVITIVIIFVVIAAIVLLLLCTKRGRRFPAEAGDAVGDITSGFGDMVD